MTISTVTHKSFREIFPLHVEIGTFSKKQLKGVFACLSFSCYS